MGYCPDLLIRQVGFLLSPVSHTEEKQTTMNCENCDKKGIVFTEMGEHEYCSCENGKNREAFDNNFPSWISQEKKKLVNKMSV